MQFLCNDFACKYDFYNIGGVSSAAIHEFQGSLFNPANNCFSTIGTNLFDIHSRGTALHFDYFTYDSLCKLPHATGNYTNVITFPSECQIGEFLVGPFTVNELNEIKSKINQIGVPQTPEMADSLDKLQVKANHLRNYLIKQIQNDNNTDLLDSILVGEDLLTSKLIKFSYNLTNNNYTLAQNSLVQLPDTFPYNEFKQIQALNLSRLQNQDNKSLSSADSTWLYEIGTSDSPNRAFARSLLYLFRGIDILEPEVEEPQEFSPGKLTIRNQKVNSINVYPNPASSTIMISIEPMTDLTWNFSIYNFQGIDLMNGKINSESIISLDISDLERGIYFMKLHSAQQGATLIKRFIVN